MPHTSQRSQTLAHDRPSGQCEVQAARRHPWEPGESKQAPRSANTQRPPQRQGNERVPQLLVFPKEASADTASLTASSEQSHTSHRHVPRVRRREAPGLRPGLTHASTWQFFTVTPPKRRPTALLRGVRDPPALGTSGDKGKGAVLHLDRNVRSCSCPHRLPWPGQLPPHCKGQMSGRVPPPNKLVYGTCLARRLGLQQASEEGDIPKSILLVTAVREEQRLLPTVVRD